MPAVPTMQGSTNRRIMVQTGQGTKQDTVLKVTSIKRAGRVGQVVKYLPSKHEALNSTSSITQKEKDTMIQENVI
jgi:hypothetical protein